MRCENRRVEELENERLKLRDRALYGVCFEDADGKRIDPLEVSPVLSPRESVEDALLRLTDGTLTFRVDEDEYTVAAMFTLDGRRYTQAWSKGFLRTDPSLADEGVRELLRKANAPSS